MGMVGRQTEHRACLEHLTLRLVDFFPHAAAHRSAQYGHGFENRMGVRRHDVVRGKLRPQDEQSRLRRITEKNDGLGALGEGRVVLVLHLLRYQFVGLVHIIDVLGKRRAGEGHQGDGG
jgi:hypothetical protein